MLGSPSAGISVEAAPDGARRPRPALRGPPMPGDGQADPRTLPRLAGELVAAGRRRRPRRGRPGRRRRRRQEPGRRGPRRPLRPGRRAASSGARRQSGSITGPPVARIVTVPSSTRPIGPDPAVGSDAPLPRIVDRGARGVLPILRTTPAAGDPRASDKVTPCRRVSRRWSWSSIVAALAPICVDLLPGRIRLPQVVLPAPGRHPRRPAAARPRRPGVRRPVLEHRPGLPVPARRLRAGPCAAARPRGAAGRDVVGREPRALALVVLVVALRDATTPRRPSSSPSPLTTTALGTLLPILRENDMLSGRFGRYVFAAGAVGELGPILAMAILLGSSGSLIELVGARRLPPAGPARDADAAAHRAHAGRGDHPSREHATSQTTLRIAVALLFVLLLVSDGSASTACSAPSWPA